MQHHHHKKSYFFIVVSMVAAIAGILFGYDTGVISGAILFINDQFQLTAQSNGMVVSAALLGAIIGALASGQIADYFGRKRLLIVVAIIFALASIVTAVSANVLEFVIGRIIIGIAIGIASYTAPLYISEIAPANHRGALVSLNQLAVSIGILVSYIVDYFFAAHGMWRWMLGVGAIPAIILFIGMLFLPYSPRWMISKNRIEHAIQILRRIRGEHHPEIESEIKAIHESLNVQHKHWSILFAKNIRPALAVAAGLAIVQQFTGINTILYYAPTILKLTHYQGVQGAILSAIPIGIVFVIFTVIGLPLIDRWGRRPLLLLGLVGMSIGLLLLAWVFAQPVHSTLLQGLALASLLLYVACFAFSLGPIMWLMISELFPLSVRGWGSSLATAVCWTSNMIVTFTFLIMVKYLGASGSFCVYFVFAILSIIFVYFFVPETKNVTLEQIEANLYAGKKARHIGA